MRTFSRTSQFKKDVKLAGKRGKDLEKLRTVLDLLIEGDALPVQYKDHPLRGNFAGSRDSKHAEVTVQSLDDWEKDWEKNPQRNAQPKLLPVDFRSLTVLNLKIG